MACNVCVGVVFNFSGTCLGTGGFLCCLNSRRRGNLFHASRLSRRRASTPARIPFMKLNQTFISRLAGLGFTPSVKRNPASLNPLAQKLLWNGPQVGDNFFYSWKIWIPWTLPPTAIKDTISQGDGEEIGNCGTRSPSTGLIFFKLHQEGKPKEMIWRIPKILYSHNSLIWSVNKSCLNQIN